MREPEMRTIARLVTAVLKNPHSDKVLDDSRRQVQRLCDAFPLLGRPESPGC
jgi:glycine/serine hydroxymethyltransferase